MKNTDKKIDESWTDKKPSETIDKNSRPKESTENGDMHSENIPETFPPKTVNGKESTEENQTFHGYLGIEQDENLKNPSVERNTIGLPSGTQQANKPSTSLPESDKADLDPENPFYRETPDKNKSGSDL